METRDKAIRLHAPSVPRPGSIRATLAGVMLYGAYVYQPPEAGRGYRQPYPQGVQSRFVETSVARLHYVRAGLGSPVVLVSPGAAWVVAWKHQFRALCENYAVYEVDLPGQGYPELKDPDDFRWDLARMTGALGSFMDAVHVRQAAVAGNSWSGGWAISFAQRHPERVSRLMLLDSSGLDVRDPWQWEIPKYPVVGELLTNLSTTKATVRDAARGVPTSDNRYRGELLGVNRAADGGRRAWCRARKRRATNTYHFEEEVWPCLK